jgi:hypothetical protein
VCLVAIIIARHQVRTPSEASCIGNYRELLKAARYPADSTLSFN